MNLSFFEDFLLWTLIDVWQLAGWILSHKWIVGDLWKKLIEYSTDVGFYKYYLSREEAQTMEKMN